MPLYISFCDWNIRSGPASSSGSATTRRCWPTRSSRQAIQNTLYYAVSGCRSTMALGLFLAVIVNQKIRGQTFFRAAFYFPAIASSAAITVLWIFLFAPDGLFNGVREALGLNPLFEFFGFGPTRTGSATAGTALNSVILLNAWTTSGTLMLFYLAFLQSIPTRSTRRRRSTAPAGGRRSGGSRSRCSRPATTSWRRSRSSARSSCSTRRSSPAGPAASPNNALMTIVLYLYNAGVREFDFGYAAAVGIMLFVIIFTVTLVQRRLFGQAPSW